MAETTFIRTCKDRNYTVLDNTFIRDVTLSWKAKGVMTYLLSLPDDWSVNFSEVLKHSADGETALKSIIKELKEHGYLISKRLQSADGKFAGFTYEIVENPQSNNHQEEKPSGGKPTEWKTHRVENNQLLNTNNTKYLNIQNTIYNKSSETKHKHGEYKNVLLTDSEKEKLDEKLGNEKADKVIGYFSELKEMKGYTYKSDYLAILKWGIKAYDDSVSQSNNRHSRTRQLASLNESYF